jgi:hypothetical protein
MGSDATQGPASGGGAAFVGQLADHARQLQHDAREAIARGDYGQASALIGDAELLAEDVHGLVDDIEDRHAGALMGMPAQDNAAPAKSARSRRPRALRVAIGASLAMSFALVEC